MFHLRKQPEPLPQYRRIPLAPSFWDVPDEEFGGHVFVSSTGSWVPDRHGSAS